MSSNTLTQVSQLQLSALDLSERMEKPSLAALLRQGCQALDQDVATQQNAFAGQFNDQGIAEILDRAMRASQIVAEDDEAVPNGAGSA